MLNPQLCGGSDHYITQPLFSTSTHSIFFLYPLNMVSTHSICSLPTHYVLHSLSLQLRGDVYRNIDEVVTPKLHAIASEGAHYKPQHARNDVGGIGEGLHASSSGGRSLPSSLLPPMISTAKLLQVRACVRRIFMRCEMHVHTCMQAAVEGARVLGLPVASCAEHCHTLPKVHACLRAMVVVPCEMHVHTCMQAAVKSARCQAPLHTSCD